jgi:hypothetical protein
MIRCVVKNEILHVIFPRSIGVSMGQSQSQFLKDQKNPDVYKNPERCLDVLRASTRYEGENEFVGFNFPASVLQESETTLYSYLPSIQYVIAYMKGDKETKAHEERHAHYYLSKPYRTSVKKAWRLLRKSNPKRHRSIVKRLRKDGYQRKVWIDEFQAYYPHLIE